MFGTLQKILTKRIMILIPVFLAILAMILTGCVTSGGVPITDIFRNSPEAQDLMNEAVDRFVAQVSTENLAGKSVLLLTRGAGPTSRMGLMNMDMSEFTGTALLHGVGWSGYIISAFERKLSSVGAKCVTQEPDLKLVISTNTAGLRSRIFYIPLIPFFVIDIYQHRTYWAVFDATIDIKTPDGQQVIKSQRHRCKSRTIHKPRLFATSEIF